METVHILPKRFQQAREYRIRTEERILNMEERLCNKISSVHKTKLNARLNLYRGAYRRLRDAAALGQYEFLAMFNRIDEGTALFDGLPNASQLCDVLRQIQYQYYAAYFALMQEAIYDLSTSRNASISVSDNPETHSVKTANDDTVFAADVQAATTAEIYRNLAPRNVNNGLPPTCPKVRCQLACSVHTDIPPDDLRVNQQPAVVEQLKQAEYKQCDNNDSLCSIIEQLRPQLIALVLERRSALSQLQMQQSIIAKVLCCSEQSSQRAKTDFTGSAHKQLANTLPGTQIWFENSENRQEMLKIEDLSTETMQSGIFALKTLAMESDLSRELRNRILVLETQKNQIETQIQQSRQKLHESICEL